MNDPATRSCEYYGESVRGLKCCAVGVKAHFGWLPVGALKFTWAATPSDAVLRESEQVYLYPSTYHIKRGRFPPYMNKFTQARYLQMPVSLLTALRADTMPALRTLCLDFADPWRDRWVPLWPTQLLWPDLRGLSSGNLLKLDIPPDNLPNLEFLATGALDQHGKVLDWIAEFGRLRHLQMHSLRNHDRVFAVVPTGLEHLRISDTKHEFSLAGIARLASLRSLELGDFRGEIDCRILAKLPMLEQLELSGTSRRVTHLESLLDCPKLAWLNLDSIRPLKGPLAKQLEARGFLGLELGPYG